MMLFDQVFVSKLGTKSLSKNPTLTMERVNEAWNKASKKKQKEVLRLANVKYAIAYRVRKIGTITTKMTIAYSQALNLDPYYLIGATDENTGYSFDAAKKLLIEECKLKKAVVEFEKANIPPKEESAPVEEVAAEPISETKSTYSVSGAIQNLKEEDLFGLFKALLIKVSVGKPEAIADLTQITEILMK